MIKRRFKGEDFENNTTISIDDLKPLVKDIIYNTVKDEMEELIKMYVNKNIIDKE
jgi:hypothetical protein